MAKLFLAAACILMFLHPGAPAQTAPSSNADAELKFVVYVSRHGVRSPTGKSSQYDQFSHGSWPVWEVPPGNLTPHGYHLMELMGAYDRALLAAQGLLSSQGCTDAAKVRFYADSDQRTRETGNALAQGLFPACKILVPSLPQGTNDPLFHLSAQEVTADMGALAAAAIAGRLGNNPAGLTEAYRTQLAALDNILATCGKPNSKLAKRTSLFDIPSALSAGKGDHLADMRGPINTASTLTENLLLEYTGGMDAASVGWGCVDGPTVKSLIGLHTAATDFTQRTPAVANLQAANLLEGIRKALQQAVEQRPVAGALGKVADRALFLIGHDTNLLNMSGALNLNWIADGRRDDTPPGGALVFELWQNRRTGQYDVRAYFTVQTLEQMRLATSLTLTAPPERVPVFIPGCSKANFACPWPSFSQVIKNISPAAARKNSILP